MDQTCNKIPLHQENPVDAALVNFTQRLNPLYRELGMTPNMLTTLSLLCALVGLWLCHNTPKWGAFGAAIFFIGYYFDCADGNFARKYGMESEFGDLYDHISDHVKVVLFLYVFARSHISTRLKLKIAGVLVVLALVLPFHIGCVEMLYDSTKTHDAFLRMASPLCPWPEEMIAFTRFGGSGTFMLAISLALWLSTRWVAK